MKKKLLSMFLLVCLLITAMPTAFIAEEGNEIVTQNLTVNIFDGAAEEADTLLEGAYLTISLGNDGLGNRVEIASQTQTGTNTCEITHNGSKFIYNDVEYSYLVLNLGRVPAGYTNPFITKEITIFDYIRMVGDGEEAVLSYTVDMESTETVAEADDYVVYRDFLNGEYQQTRVEYYTTNILDLGQLAEALGYLTDQDVWVTVEIEFSGEGFPEISEEAMTIMADHYTELYIYNSDTGEAATWYSVVGDRAFELNEITSPSVSDGLEAEGIPYVLLTAKGFNGAEDFEAMIQTEYGVLKDGAYDEEQGVYVGQKYVYLYDLATDTFKKCEMEVPYITNVNPEAPEENDAIMFIAGVMFPTAGWYVIVDEELPASLTTVPSVPTPPVEPEGDVPSPEVQELKATWSATKSWTVDVQNVSVGESPMEYDIEIYKDGKYVGYDYCWGYAGDKISFDISHFVAVNGAGKYTVEVEVYENENWYLVYEGTSEARTYTKPASQLATPANVSFNTETGAMKFDTVEGAVAYDIWFEESYAGNEHPGFRTVRLENNDTSVCDFTWILDIVNMYKEDNELVDVCLTIGVCAVSEDIDKVASSELARVVIFENKVSKEEVKEAFDKALENVEEEPYEAAAVLDGVSNDTLVEMIKTDAEFAQKVEKLDNVLIEDLGDGYKGATSKTDAVDASKVTVVGAAINGRFANTVELTFEEPAEEAVVPTGYTKGVQLDISLLIDGRAQENLNVPITITMPIPAGVDTKDLVILHYHGDATEPVVIVPTVNTDGTMTFIVDGFSTFVVTNQVAEVTAPITGDTSTTAMVCSLLLLAVGVVLMKRNAFAK